MDERTRQERIRICRRRHEAAPQSRAFAPLADLLRQDGRHEEALALLEDGLVRHPEFTGAMVILGRTLLDTGRVDHARRVLEQVLVRDPENLVALRVLAGEAADRGAVAVARPLLERLVALDPEPEAWQDRLAALEARGGDAEASAAEPAPEPDPEPAPPSPVESAPAPELSPAVTPVRAAEGAGDLATMTLVEICLAQGYRRRAIAALHEILAREPDHAEARQRLADLGPETDGPEDAGPAPEGSDDRRERFAVRRAQEKRSFSEWIDRLQDDGKGAPH